MTKQEDKEGKRDENRFGLQLAKKEEGNVKGDETKNS